MSPRTRNRAKQGRVRRLARLFSLVVVILSLFLGLLAMPAGRAWLDGAMRNLAWVDRKVRLRLGMPLRGTPDLSSFKERLAEKGLKAGGAVFIRIFKRESELELWIRKGGQFTLFATYPICRWSGRLGPKLKEGDRQSPEGFYTVAQNQLNPNSRWHRSFNLGFPNRLDRAHGRTGSFLMVHGGCGSIGCYAMTNPVIDEIWRLVTAALRNGQPRFHVHVFPFRMTGWNMTLYGHGEWNGFWRDLKKGHDLFEKTHRPPEVSVCGSRYAVSEGKPGSAGGHPISDNCAPTARK